MICKAAEIIFNFERHFLKAQLTSRASLLRQISLSLNMTTCFHKYTPPEGQTQVIARAHSISLIRCLFRLVKCKFTEPLYKSAWYTLLSLLIFSTYALSIKREGHNLTKKKKKEISRLLRLLHSSAVMLSKARYCDIAVIATALRITSTNFKLQAVKHTWPHTSDKRSRFINRRIFFTHRQPKDCYIYSFCLISSTFYKKNYQIMPN